MQFVTSTESGDVSIKYDPVPSLFVKVRPDDEHWHSISYLFGASNRTWIVLITTGYQVAAGPAPGYAIATVSEHLSLTDHSGKHSATLVMGT